MSWTDDDIKRALAQNPELGIEGGADVKPQVRATRTPPGKTLVPMEYAATIGATFASKTEAAALQHLIDTYHPIWLKYEPLLFRLPGGNYKPDYVFRQEGGQIVFVEVKGGGGFQAYQSGRSSKKGLREAAYHYGWMGEWRLLVKGKDGWKEYSATDLRKVK